MSNTAWPQAFIDCYCGAKIGGILHIDPWGPNGSSFIPDPEDVARHADCFGGHDE